MNSFDLIDFIQGMSEERARVVLKLIKANITDLLKDKEFWKKFKQEER